MEDFKGKVAVITGGASGIGFATAQALAREGARIVIADIEQKALAAAVDKLQTGGADVVGIKVDVADKASVQYLADQAWDTFGAVHILFNNAGVAVGGPTQYASHADWEWSINVNLWGPIHGVEAFVPRMVAQKQGGHVLFTASFAGLVPNRNLGPYCVTKFGVVALAECLHKDLREHGIGSSVLMPMRVESNIDYSKRNRPTDFGGPTPESIYSEEEYAQLSGRMLSVEPVAKLVLDGMRNNALFIHTHPEAREFVRRRWERLDAAFAFAD
jgi:NAD(P)-dependent dehydrogenase (short-subunit alcohol dehydrogenase family)